jgi:hypothetical protein
MTNDDQEEDTGPVEPLEDASPAEPVDDAERITLLWNGFEDLVARLDTSEEAIEDALGELDTRIGKLKEQLAELLKKEQEKDIKPRRWAARATRKDWDDLIDWVDRLNADYALLDDYLIPPCWPAHPGVVEELAGLWRSWTRTMIIDETAKGSGDTSLTSWHDRWLWPCLHRMKSGHYRTTNCRDRHQSEPKTARITDRSFSPTRARER